MDFAAATITGFYPRYEVGDLLTIISGLIVPYIIVVWATALLLRAAPAQIQAVAGGVFCFLATIILILPGIAIFGMLKYGVHWSELSRFELSFFSIPTVVGATLFAGGIWMYRTRNRKLRQRELPHPP